MTHFAKIENNLVTNVIVAEQDFVDTQEGTWVQTSYNTHGGNHALGGTPLRKNYAAIGMVYDTEIDAFYDQQPFPSWLLNRETCFWEPPIPRRPDDSSLMNSYAWDEPNRCWVKLFRSPQPEKNYNNKMYVWNGSEDVAPRPKITDQDIYNNLWVEVT